MKKPHIFIVFLFIICTISCDNKKHEEKNEKLKQQSKLDSNDSINENSINHLEYIEIKRKNRSDLLKRPDIKSIKYRFDSLSYKWSSDTLYIQKFEFVKGKCSDYSLKSKLINGNLNLALNDNSNCELATILEINCTILIKKEFRAFPLKFDGKEVK